MAYICLKYSGLKFNHIFETKSFVFIPQSKVELTDSEILYPMDFFSCVYDKNSEFYVLLKESIEGDITIQNFREEKLHKFKFLEAVITLLFSNYLRREYIFILENEASEYILKSVIKCLLNNYHKFNRTLLWKNSIFTKFLGEIIERSLEKYNSITLKEDFVTKFAYSIDMYLRGKFGESSLISNSDLWISLEVLSEITISRILHSHGTIKVKNFYKQLKEIVKEYSSKVQLENIDCWSPMKEKFSDHMANKINSHLPILKKCIKLVEEFKLTVQNIKVSLHQETDYDDPAKYQEYLDKIKDFKDYQDELSIKEVLKTIYGDRNALFHEGKISEEWSLESDRVKANFIKILEQLFFSILGLDVITYYQMGYPYQYIFGVPITAGEIKDLGGLSNLIWIYMHENYVEPLHTDYKDPFDYQPVKEKYINNPNEFDPLRDLLNSTLEKILNFLNSSHPTQILVNGLNFDYNLDYQILNKKNVKLLGLDSGIIPIVYDRKQQVIIKNQDTTNISSIFIGRFIDDIGFDIDTITVPFRINPPYISFKLL